MYVHIVRITDDFIFENLIWHLYWEKIHLKHLVLGTLAWTFAELWCCWALMAVPSWALHRLTPRCEPHALLAPRRGQLLLVSISALGLPHTGEHGHHHWVLQLSYFANTIALCFCNIICYTVFISKCLLFLEALGKRK